MSAAVVACAELVLTKDEVFTGLRLLPEQEDVTRPRIEPIALTRPIDFDIERDGGG